MKHIVELAKAIQGENTVLRIVTIDENYRVVDLIEPPANASPADIILDYLMIGGVDFIEFRDPNAPAGSEPFQTVYCDHSLTDAYLAQRFIALMKCHLAGYTENDGELVKDGSGVSLFDAYRAKPNGDNGVYLRQLR
jgi:hypothetical protein